MVCFIRKNPTKYVRMTIVYFGKISKHRNIDRIKPYGISVIMRVHATVKQPKNMPMRNGECFERTPAELLANHCVIFTNIWW